MNEGLSSTDWRSIIHRGIESEELDYKAAVNWYKLGRAGKAKFARHCMAMANTKGGYIVVGVAEDRTGRPCVYTGVNNLQSKSFDPTDVGNVINRYSDPPMDFDIERPSVDGKRYVIFVIRRFSMIPHVCSYSCDSELQQGVFYIRTPDASSRPAYKASEVHSMVQKALRNQRELLGRMLRGVLYEGKKFFDPQAKGEFIEQIHHSRGVFEKMKQLGKNASGVLCEISVFPSEFFLEKFSLSQIKTAVDNSVIMSSINNSFIVIGESDECYFTNVAYRSFSKGNRQFWQAFKSGLFHCITTILDSSKELDYRELVKIIAETIQFLGRYYYELGYTDELFNVRVKLSNVEGVALVGVENAEKGGRPQFVCRIPEVDVKLQRSAADLMSGTIGHSTKFVEEICERFNLPDGRHSDLDKMIGSIIQNS